MCLAFLSVDFQVHKDFSATTWNAFLHFALAIGTQHLVQVFAVKHMQLFSENFQWCNFWVCEMQN